MQTNIYEDILLLKSERKSIRFVEPFLSKIHAYMNISDEKYYNILIAVTEAVNNAIIHGNKCILCKSVKVSIQGNLQTVTITVSDQGSGFDHNEIEDPRDPQNLLKIGGRGVFLIKELADSAEFSNPSEGGSLVKMTFVL
jgi:serine/threonine-protein kinase RsbW